MPVAAPAGWRSGGRPHGRHTCAARGFAQSHGGGPTLSRQRKGTLMWFVPRPRLRLQTPPDALCSYTFHKPVIHHYFCPTCGMHPFGEGVGPDGSAMAAVNIRCLEGVDVYDISVHHYDGRDV